MENNFVTGIVRSTHGLDGEMKVESLSGETAHFLNLQSVVLRKGGFEKECRVASVRAAGNVVFLRLDGIVSVEAAKTLVKSEILVKRENACPLNKGEYYIEDLKLCSLFFDGKNIAKIVDVLEGGGGFLLQIDLTDEFLCEKKIDAKERTRLIPFRKEFISQVDLKNSAMKLVSLAILE